MLLIKLYAWPLDDETWDVISSVREYLPSGRLETGCRSRHTSSNCSDKPPPDIGAGKRRRRAHRVPGEGPMNNFEMNLLYDERSCNTSFSRKTNIDLLLMKSITKLKNQYSPWYSVLTIPYWNESCSGVDHYEENYSPGSSRPVSEVFSISSEYFSRATSSDHIYHDLADSDCCDVSY